MKQLSKIILLVLVAVALFYGYSFITDRGNEQPEVTTQESQLETVFVSIDGLYNNKRVDVQAGATVLEMLEMLDKEDAKVHLGIKEYSGLGTLVESIGGKTNGTDDKYWQYMVNDVMPQVGADSLVLNDGDSVTWEFKESEF